MAKLSYMQFDVYNWINDTRELSAEAKGCWIDILCLMWNAPSRGYWKGTHQEFARATGIAWEDAPRIISELGKKVGNVATVDSEVTLENRRMIREDLAWKNKLKRQNNYRERHKSDAKTTPIDIKDIKDIKDTKDIRQHPTPLSDPPKAAASDLPPLGTLFEKIWSQYPNKDGKKAAERHFKVSVKTTQDWLDIQRALTNYLKSEKVRKGFIKNGSTWFNNWQDWINYEEESHASHGGAGVHSISDLGRRALEVARLRKAKFQGTTGALLDRIRDDAMPEKSAEESNGPGDLEDGSPLV